jgi:3',5'-cyclic AMP phosphodiesterase CpdA
MHPFTRRQFIRSSSLIALGSFGPAAYLAGKDSAKIKKAEAKPAEQDPYADAKFVDGPPPLPADGAFTIAVLPDTQKYKKEHAAGFGAQTQWIADQSKARRIACVLHLGDITDDNLPEQWENAAAAMKRLDGKVPYFMAPGNHDYGKGGGADDRTSLFSKYFPVSSFEKRPTTGGFYDKEPDRVENSYHFFEAAGRRFLVLCLEFGPRRDVVRWANEVVAKHADREAILVTHVFTYHDSTRYDFKKFGKAQSWNPHVYGLAKASNGDVSDGQELWDNLVSRHPNFIFTINGHVLGDGLGRLVTATPNGRKVPQMLVNFQMKPKGGDGWLRLLEMRPDGSLLSYDYSPTRNQTNAGVENQFQVKLSSI